MESDGRKDFSCGNRKEGDQGPERKHLANGTEQYYKIRKSGKSSMNWVGKTVRGCQMLGGKEEEESS